MTFDKSQYHNEYAKKKLKRIPLDVSLEKYDKIKKHASTKSETVNGFIKRAIDEAIERDNK
ncbi:ribbon-helix-helix domain-containing protein [Butyrivibrio sp. AC2005]|uniref:ribbon-helix-helix domain-containing protein n=1 Tax=Butyrivibrio sp. AC2005 TaxID=1280672 RepID=UPI00041E42FB|nr:ribbon-helix-helix domain-containing protein [Butyrivibrio sp. AC2005]